MNDRGIWLESTAAPTREAKLAKMANLQGANARLEGIVNAARKTLSERHDEVQKAVSEARQKAATAEALKCAAESRASSQKTKRLEADAEIAKLTDERDVAQATEAATRTKLAALEVQMRKEVLATARASLRVVARDASLRKVQVALTAAKQAKRTQVADRKKAAKEAEFQRRRREVLEAELLVVSELYGLLQASVAKGTSVADKRGEQNSRMRAEVGMRDGYVTVPERCPESECSRTKSWQLMSIRHIAAVLARRPADLIARAMQAVGLREGSGAGASMKLVREVNATPAFRSLEKAAVKRAVELVQDHWTARLSVHLQTRLDLSRNDMDKLRHLLSFVYDDATDEYVPIKVWVNPDDKDDYVVTASLVGRKLREREYNMIASGCDISVCTVTGRSERDTVKVTEELYAKYHKALRTDYSLWDAQPVFYIDATGVGLGRGFTHAEMGCSDFVGDAKQSRSTMQPLAAYSGSDKTNDIADNLQLALPGFNAMVKSKKIFPGPMFPQGLPVRPIVAADMQAVKALFGMVQYSHSVWCMCQKNEQHSVPERAMNTWQECLHWYDSVGCALKTLADCCEFAHYSLGVLLGTGFTPVKCRCCGYERTDEASWRIDFDAFNAASDAEQKAMHAEHVEQGIKAPAFCKHYFQLYMTPPLVHLDLMHGGADILHLIYLNLFKHLFGATCHYPLPGVLLCVCFVVLLCY